VTIDPEGVESHGPGKRVLVNSLAFFSKAIPNTPTAAKDGRFPGLSGVFAPRPRVVNFFLRSVSTSELCEILLPRSHRGRRLCTDINTQLRVKSVIGENTDHKQTSNTSPQHLAQKNCACSAPVTVNLAPGAQHLRLSGVFARDPALSAFFFAASLLQNSAKSCCRRSPRSGRLGGDINTQPKVKTCGR
jgi:hypothetical protein